MTTAAVMTAGLRRQISVTNSSGGYCSDRILVTDISMTLKMQNCMKTLLLFFYVDAPCK